MCRIWIRSWLFIHHTLSHIKWRLFVIIRSRWFDVPTAQNVLPWTPTVIIYYNKQMRLKTNESRRPKHVKAVRQKVCKNIWNISTKWNFNRNQKKKKQQQQKMFAKTILPIQTKRHFNRNEVKQKQNLFVMLFQRSMSIQSTHVAFSKLDSLKF